MIEKDALVKIKNTLPREEKSLFSTETNVSAEDQILTLITCKYTIENGRFFYSCGRDKGIVHPH